MALADSISSANAQEEREISSSSDMGFGKTSGLFLGANKWLPLWLSSKIFILEEPARMAG